MPSPASDPTDLIKLCHGAEDEVLIHRHGATVISWKEGGEERLFLSEHAILDGTKPIRGGIPIVFPQFGTGAIMAGQHGFARQSSNWSFEQKSVNKAEATLESNEQTLSQWPHRFLLKYQVELDHKQLKTTLIIQNTDSHPWTFTALLHTYLKRTSDTITGLAGISYRDKLEGGKKKLEEEQAVKIDREIDRAYLDVADSVSISNIEVRMTGGFKDLVVWNPWIEKSKAMADFGDHEYLSMICLEPGAIKDPIALAPGAVWTGTQILTVIN